MKHYIIKRKSIYLEVLMMTNDETIFTAMTFIKTDGISCLKKEMFLLEEVVLEEFHGRILYISLEDTWRNKMNTIKTCLSITWAKTYGSNYLVKELFHLLELITQQIFTKSKFTYLVDSMGTKNTLTFTPTIWRKVNGWKL